MTDDDRIKVVDSNEATRGIAHWYGQADALMALGNEGFGLPLVEGMATGMPVIALNSEGQADVCRDAGELVLSVPPGRWEKVTNPGLGDGGVRAIPSVADIAGHLRWIADHREEAKHLGRAASRWAITHRNVWAMGPAVIDAMESHLRTHRPLRRRPMVCCPETDTSTSDYALHLCDEIGYAVAVGERPRDLRGTRVLHFQHAPGLWDELLLTRLAQEARYSGIPVVVTEHSVEDRASAFEQVASALVVDVDAGLDPLRKRLPGTRIEVVSPGCPSWCEARAGRRGQTVALIGWPQPDNGWSEVLDTLRVRPRVSLVAVRRGGSDSAWRDWRAAASGLPIEVRDAPSARAAAETVADCADVVVLWHKSARGVGTSYQARVALASGLPVLTSTAPQFADLQPAIYQPASLGDGVDRILEDDDLRNRVVDAAHRFKDAHAWARAAEQHRAIWSSVVCA